MNTARILVAEDEDIAREYMVQALRDRGFEVHEARTGKEAETALLGLEFAVVVSDIRMPDMDGMRLLEKVKDAWPDTEVIMATGYASVEDAVSAMKMGAFHYLAKPLRLDELCLMVDRAVEKRRMREELHSLKQQLQNADARIIGHSAAVQDLKRHIRQAGQADCTVLILGETGTGKELAARSLHAASPRAGGRFLAVNCAAFSDDLLANELFGHEKAAFTGATGVQKGLLEAAHKGTFFLDEIGDMSLAMQASLLRVLETRTLLRVGGTREIPVDVRVVAATNRDLPAMVEAGAFRRDLFYRLNIITLCMPPLRERREDIPLLARFFLTKSRAATGKDIRDISPAALDRLTAHHYPGNVRELEHIMERAAILCAGEVITQAHLPREITAQNHAPDPEASAFVSLEENERRYLASVLEAAGGSTSEAARLLDINRGTLWRKLKRLGLTE